MNISVKIHIPDYSNIALIIVIQYYSNINNNHNNNYVFPVSFCFLLISLKFGQKKWNNFDSFIKLIKF